MLMFPASWWRVFSEAVTHCHSGLIPALAWQHLWEKASFDSLLRATLSAFGDPQCRIVLQVVSGIFHTKSALYSITVLQTMKITVGISDDVNTERDISPVIFVFYASAMCFSVKLTHTIPSSLDSDPCVSFPCDFNVCTAFLPLGTKTRINIPCTVDEDLPEKSSVTDIFISTFPASGHKKVVQTRCIPRKLH